MIRRSHGFTIWNEDLVPGNGVLRGTLKLWITTERGVGGKLIFLVKMLKLSKLFYSNLFHIIFALDRCFNLCNPQFMFLNHQIENKLDLFYRLVQVHRWAKQNNHFKPHQDSVLVRWWDFPKANRRPGDIKREREKEKKIVMDAHYKNSQKSPCPIKDCNPGLCDSQTKLPRSFGWWQINFFWFIAILVIFLKGRCSTLCSKSESEYESEYYWFILCLLPFVKEDCSHI